MCCWLRCARNLEPFFRSTSGIGSASPGLGGCYLGSWTFFGNSSFLGRRDWSGSGSLARRNRNCNCLVPGSSLARRSGKNWPDRRF